MKNVIKRLIIEKIQPSQVKTFNDIAGASHDKEKNTVNIVKCSHVHVTDVLVDNLRSVKQPSVCHIIVVVFKYIQVPSAMIESARL